MKEMLKGIFMLRFACALISGFVVIAVGFDHAQAGIVITVDKTTQHLKVDVDGVIQYNWPVSTARAGYKTPNGTYHPEWLARKWHSRQYDWSPMPHSIFFHNGYAIHGSYEVSRIGRPASHGCIRLRPANAAILFTLVQKNMSDTEIVVTGNAPKAVVKHRSVRKRRDTAAQPWPGAEPWPGGFDGGFFRPFYAR
jgi:hypothetical protein